MKLPDVIYLQWHGDEHPDDVNPDQDVDPAGASWCWERIFPADYEYIRGGALMAEVRRLRAENAMLTEQLAQERKRLDWALSHDVVYCQWDGVWWFHWTMSDDVTDMIETDNPRATIDELIAAEAAGGGK